MFRPIQRYSPVFLAGHPTSRSLFSIKKHNEQLLENKKNEEMAELKKSFQAYNIMKVEMQALRQRFQPAIQENTFKAILTNTHKPYLEAQGTQLINLYVCEHLLTRFPHMHVDYVLDILKYINTPSFASELSREVGLSFPIHLAKNESNAKEFDDINPADDKHSYEKLKAKIAQAELKAGVFIDEKFAETVNKGHLNCNEVEKLQESFIPDARLADAFYSIVGAMHEEFSHPHIHPRVVNFLDSVIISFIHKNTRLSKTLTFEHLRPVVKAPREMLHEKIVPDLYTSLETANHPLLPVFIGLMESEGIPRDAVQLRLHDEVGRYTTLPTFNVGLYLHSICVAQGVAHTLEEASFEATKIALLSRFFLEDQTQVPISKKVATE